ncbi:MAG: sugar transferase [Bacteroidales bacterium]|nr:sugar transferase [Bacteroidales bacterium]
MIRFFDVILSISGLIILSPLFILLSLWIKVDSNGPIFYKQKRVGKGNIDFVLLKFRTMYLNSDKIGLITIGNNDPRVTRLGYIIRKYKMDELPQLINVFIGDMSLVGPRPEVRKYVDFYTEKQKNILSIKPGITDYASIIFRNENDLLAKSPEPEKYYINDILPQKIELNMIYIQNRSFYEYFKVIFLTLFIRDKEKILKFQKAKG